MDPKGFLQNADFLVQNGIKMMASSIENNFYKTLRGMKEEVTFESFKDLNNEPFLSLVHDVMKSHGIN